MGFLYGIKAPNTLPLVGNGIVFLQARQKLFSWFVACQRLFGHETFQISVPTLPPGVVINDPKNLDFVFKNEAIFTKGSLFKRLSWDLFGSGIINSDGELWKVQRKAGMAFLNPANLRILTDIALPQYLTQSMEDLKKSGEDGRVVDMQVVFHEISSQLMGKMAYDMEMHADDDFTVAFEYASGATAERFQNPLWFLTEPLFGSRFRKSLATIRSFGSRIVESAVSHRHINGKTDGDLVSDTEILDKASGSLIQSLLGALGGDKRVVMDSALNYLSAGRDTVAQALTWTMYLLIQHKYAMENIRSEIQALREKTRSDDSVEATSTHLTPTALPYTMAVFYETLRLYPPIPFEIRQCTTPTTLPDGTFLPTDTIVFWCLLAFNKSKLTWGDDADSFRPERWLTKGGKLIARSAAEFPVFNGGKRTCLGQRMAEVMAIQVIAAMVSEFEFMPAYEGERVSKSRNST
ncbi:hypothetical protein DL762_001656 [Monosporascus cannonballus]|uniref:Cytochrome P450 n=1 Tax=Monosporascus cannonballus TaxID=155416 RepID=A0ABY0HFM7_9PEZI|nr:hypothetical protein DL762_001656 [Monosporascus cannonballus]